MVKENQVAYGVRVVLNENWIPSSLGDHYLKDEPVLYIGYHGIMNDQLGKYVRIYGGSGMNSGIAYLNEIDLKYPVPESPLYQLYQGKVENHPEIKCSHMYGEDTDGKLRCIYCRAVKDEQPC